MCRCSRPHCGTRPPRREGVNVGQGGGEAVQIRLAELQGLGLQHHKQRRQSLAGWQRECKERRCLLPLSLTCTDPSKAISAIGSMLIVRNVYEIAWKS